MPSRRYKKNGGTRKRRSSGSSSLAAFQKEIAVVFLEMLLMVKLFHWKTSSYATHKATDELYERLNENIDKFVEVMLGKTESRLDMKGKKIEFTDPSTKKSLKNIVNKYKILLEDKMNKYIDINKDTDLLNIRDEILGNINQFLYLITFS